MTNNPDVTIIIPAHNEEEGITDVINGIKQLNTGYKIIVVDDGSTDNTYKLASETGVKIIRHPYNKGYGAAIKRGIKNATNDLILIIDVARSYPVKDVLADADQYDLVVGARKGEEVKIQLYRRPAKWFLSKLANYLTETKISDLNLGIWKSLEEKMLSIFHFPTTFKIFLHNYLDIVRLPLGYRNKKMRIRAK